HDIQFIIEFSFFNKYNLISIFQSLYSKRQAVFERNAAASRTCNSTSTLSKSLSVQRYNPIILIGRRTSQIHYPRSHAFIKDSERPEGSSFFVGKRDYILFTGFNRILLTTLIFDYFQTAFYFLVHSSYKRTSF